MADDVANDRRTLAELAEASGVAVRTIRYYIARELLPPPLVGGRAACYGAEHLDRLAKIQALQAQGLTLAQISWKLGERREDATLPQPTAWWNYPLADGVVVQVRADTPPWRLKRVRSLLAQMAAQLYAEKNTEEDDAG
jgi:DNA-binding transcriptional MerR regulator